jgi:hypothetical protein
MFNDVEIALSTVVNVVFAVDRLRQTPRMNSPTTRP